MIGAWVATALAAPGAVVDVSVGAGPEGAVRWAAVDASGAVWVSPGDGGRWTLVLAGLDAEAPAGGPGPAVAHAADGTLVVARADGLWHARGGGWVRELPEPTTAACTRPDGRWVVGTPTGVRTGVFGGPWSPVEVGPGEVRDVSCAGGAAVAGAHGVWVTGDGAAWSRLPGPNDATAVAGGGQWFAAAGRLWVSSSARTAPAAVLRLPAVQAATEVGGVWVAVGPSGAVASADGGTTWVVRSDLPAGTADVADAGGELLLATPSGPQVRPVAPPGAAADPVGVAPREPAPARVRHVRLARWMPALDVVWTGRMDRVAPTPDAPGVRSGWWTVGAALTVVPPAAPAELDPAPTDDGEPVSDASVDLALAAAVTREASARRTRRLEALRELQAARRIAAEQERTATTVLDRAQAALRVAEIDARLHALVPERAGGRP